MITKETYKELILVGANIARMQYRIQMLNNIFDSKIENTRVILADVMGDDNFDTFNDAVSDVCNSYELTDSMESLCDLAATLNTQYANPIDVKMAFLDSVSAVALDEENGEQFADLMTEYLTTGEGAEELRALEKEMSKDALYWLRRLL